MNETQYDNIVISDEDLETLQETGEIVVITPCGEYEIWTEARWQEWHDTFHRDEIVEAAPWNNEE